MLHGVDRSSLRRISCEGEGGELAFGLEKQQESGGMDDILLKSL